MQLNWPGVGEAGASMDAPWDRAHPKTIMNSETQVAQVQGWVSGTLSSDICVNAGIGAKVNVHDYFSVIICNIEDSLVR